MEHHRMRMIVRTLTKVPCYTGLCFLLLGAAASYGQFLDQGGITGVVKDPSGAVIPGAQVALENTETNLVLHVTTNGAGVYIFSPIPIGHYKVTVTSPGFRQTSQENLTLQLQQRLNIPITLYPGAVTQSVQVTTAPPLLQTEESSVGQVVTTEQINNTPLNGRNWVFMVQLTPGAVPSTSRAKGSGDFNANGLRAEENDFVLDGMDNKSISVDYLGGSSFLVNPPPDALAEFKVSTADYSAEFGHSAGAVVDASIKSGTNQVHGDVWEYWRNNILDAKDFDALTIPEFRQNLFGGTLGFPIIKNRLFFFGDVQENRIAAAQPYTQAVPTPLERQGNFSELLNTSLTGEAKPFTLYEPGSGTKLMQCNGQQNVLCANQIDSVAQNILNLYPAPNANGGRTYANNVQNLSQPQNTWQWDARVDWNISQKDQAFARFSDFNQMGNYAGPLGPILDGSCGEGSDCVSGLQLDFGNNFVISETHIFNPSLVNEFRFGYDYGHFDTYQLNYRENTAATLGLGGMLFGADVAKDNGGLPQIGISGIAQAGTHAYRPEVEKENEYQILDNVSKTAGRHSIKMGVSLQSIRSYTLEPPASHPQYSYTGFFTGSYSAAFTGSGIADFITDEMDHGSIGPSSAFNDAWWNISGYAQDDWRFTDKLTLNLGVRYDWFQPYFEMQNHQASFVPTGTPGIATGSGSFSYPIQDQGKLSLSTPFLANLQADNIALQYSSQRGLTKEQVLNFSPRVGFAYSINSTTVLHGGFGIFYQGQQNAGAADNLGTNYPFVFSDNFVRPSCSKPNPCANVGYNMETGFQSAIDQGLATFVTNPSLNGQSAYLKTTYAMDYNLTAQKALTNNLVATMGYVGTVGRHLPVGLNPNSTTVLLAPGITNQSYLPFPQFGGFTYLDYVGFSSYNALQTKLEKRMSNGLDFLATYTWSHAMDDAAEPLGGGIGGYRDENMIPIRDDYTNSGWDTRHRFTFNGYYQIPYGSGTAHPIHSKVLDAVLGGWATNLTFQMQTGQPFSVSVADITPATGGTKYAIPVRDPFAPGGSPNPTNPSITCPTKVRTLQHWYNPCAFQNPLSGKLIPAPKAGQNPNIPPPGYGYPAYVTGITNALAFLGGRSNQVYGPGYNRLDMSYFKSFPTFRQQYLQFRVDVFNLLNTPEWANPSIASDGQNGGLITSARSGQVYTPDARFFQLSAKYVF